MDSPLGPALANIFMIHLEKLFFKDMIPQPLFYGQYVDDTFALFKNLDEANCFLDYINSLYPNIKFTMEVESDNNLSFLDVKVVRGDGSFQTGVFRKSTFTGQGSNFLSFCSSLFKKNACRTLIHRAYNLSSGYKEFHKEILCLSQYFMNNSFPTDCFLPSSS